MQRGGPGFSASVGRETIRKHQCPQCSDRVVDGFNFGLIGAPEGSSSSLSQESEPNQKPKVPVSRLLQLHSRKHFTAPNLPQLNHSQASHRFDLFGYYMVKCWLSLRFQVLHAVTRLHCGSVPDSMHKVLRHGNYSSMVIWPALRAALPSFNIQVVSAPAAFHILSMRPPPHSDACKLAGVCSAESFIESAVSDPGASRLG